MSWGGGGSYGSGTYGNFVVDVPPDPVTGPTLGTGNLGGGTLGTPQTWRLLRPTPPSVRAMVVHALLQSQPVTQVVGQRISTTRLARPCVVVFDPGGEQMLSPYLGRFNVQVDCYADREDVAEQLGWYALHTCLAMRGRFRGGSALGVEQLGQFISDRDPVSLTYRRLFRLQVVARGLNPAG